MRMEQPVSLVKDPDDIKLAMLGWVDNNHHPYSWSAIFNGDFDDDAMAQCGCPPVPDYLNANRDALGIDGARVTHVWADDPDRAVHLSRASLIPHVVERPEDVIGHVDAVLIPTDRGYEHLERARPFIEAGLPVFIDKPLTDREDHLEQFVRWHNEGKQFMSCSGLRYSEYYEACRARLHEVGEMRVITCAICKSWESYGIHVAEGVYPFLEPGGWLSTTNTGTKAANIVHARHARGVDVIFQVVEDIGGANGALTVLGTDGWLTAQHISNFLSFKIMFSKFVEYLRTGQPPFPFEQTIELMKLIIAGTRSREEGGRTVKLSEIKA
jgi:predicted dehydrogenase